MRIALKIAYDGTKYHGFARQPNIKTIEGAIIDALMAIGAIKDVKNAQLGVASRTDKGVHAWDNLIALTTSLKIASLIPALSHALESIWIIAYAPVLTTFHPRYAIRRKYRYYLVNDDLDIHRMKKVAKLFIGEHDFSNFAKIENKDSVRTIDKIIIHGDNIIKIDFTAKSFLWNQVRRMVSAIEKVGKGESIDAVRKTLTDKKRINFGIAPAENLVLLEVTYAKDLNFNYLEYTDNILKRRIENMQRDLLMLRDMKKYLFKDTNRRN